LAEEAKKQARILAQQGHQPTTNSKPKQSAQKPPPQSLKAAIREALADVFAYAFLRAHNYGLDVKQMARERIQKNALKQPAKKAKRSAKKYTKL
jgi:NTP pyrophosphatase (non-canonical NTP hydrolase)